MNVTLLAEGSKVADGYTFDVHAGDNLKIFLDSWIVEGFWPKKLGSLENHVAQSRNTIAREWSKVHVLDLRCTQQ